MRHLFLFSLLLFYIVSAQENVTISGTIGNYPGGTMYLKFVTYSPDYNNFTLDETTVNEDGSFSFKLGLPPSETFQLFTDSFAIYEWCHLTITEEALEVANANLNYIKDDNDTGFLDLASSGAIFSSDPSTIPNNAKVAAPIYASTASSVTGLCNSGTRSEPNLVSVALNFKTGWNFIVATFVKTPTATRTLMTVESSDGLIWYLPTF
jgi:Domain of unknown function (DUF4369)